MHHGTDAGAYPEDTGHDPRGGHVQPVSLLLRAPGTRGAPLILMRRVLMRPVLMRPVLMRGGSAGTREGRYRWELPGGIRRGAEIPADTARRAARLVGVDPKSMRVRGVQDGDGSDHPTVIADISEPPAAQPHDQGAHDEGPDDEGAAPTWIAEPDVGALELDPALAAAWPGLLATETGLLVDAANVVGSRPDGWWRDRAGAAERLLREIADATPGTFPAGDGRFAWVTRPVVVLEGAAKRAPDVPGVDVIRAPGSGDDTIVDVARRGGAWIVVTADRGLRARLPSRARAVGPAALHAWLSSHPRHPPQSTAPAPDA